MKTKQIWHWQQKVNKHIFILSTLTIVHQCLYVSVIKDVAHIQKFICNKNNHQNIYNENRFLLLTHIIIIL